MDFTLNITAPAAGQSYDAGDTVNMEYTYEGIPDASYEVNFNLYQIIDGANQTPGIHPVAPDVFVTGAYGFKTSTKNIPGTYHIGVQLVKYSPYGTSTETFTNTFEITAPEP